METYYAKINEKNIVENVIVADYNFIKTQTDKWIQCGEGSNRHMASVNYIYSEKYDNFHPPLPYPSWYLDENCVIQAPRPLPYIEFGNDDRRNYEWNEDKLEWVLVE